MLVDTRTVPDGARIECDICIVGTGAAGLSIIQQFIGSGRKICAVESGGLELDPDTQALYQGDNVGLPYFPLDACRLRQFGGTTWPDDLEGANHHLGTTRMHDDPHEGVVDSNCKVHGIDNLYVAGSSVFPTPGIGTPTMMIIAMSLRLADHLKDQKA